ncbi:MAG TPA: alpha-glucan family phosphorylase [Bryobacteraceae bacterium]|nr:alpha-glucan family phosphorylase [Bryobacteraceae bacterium]
MSNPQYTNLAAETRADDPLIRLALDVHWSWNHSTDKLWERLDAELWDLTHNPWVVLQTVSSQKLDAALADPEFQKMLAEFDEARTLRDGPKWYKRAHPNAALKTVAYFSMEYMLSEALPIYSGGLGNVAGDQLKAANDLGVPVVGIGLLYQQGYFRQAIDGNGNQIALYPYNDPGQLPIKPLRDPQGDWLRLRIGLPGYPLWVRCWEVQVGETKLYLMDSNDPANLPKDRGMTSELYGGGPELRVRQEQILGIGGWRLLRALNINPDVCHLNEGHAAFAVLERARSYMEETGQPFDVALAVTRAGNLFTTHTPVEAGFDRFSQELMRPYFAPYAEDRLHISFDDLMALGRRNRYDASEPFNMAYLAIRGSGAINGVSRLHGTMSRKLFQPLFPRWPEAEVPVGHVTNGVHVATWDSTEADRLWTEHCGAGCWRGDLKGIEEGVRQASDERLWSMRVIERRKLIEEVRVRNLRQVARWRATAEENAAAERIFHEDTLTIGFARRFATYKRPNLLLHDPDRLVRILTNAAHPVQLLLAGKAHPADLAGQAMIRQWNEFLRRPEVQQHAAFLPDYDMLLTERMVAGVDLWINTPRRPWEASGTSGMKVLVNGGLNVSELDGWWVEAYTPQVGWALGDGREHGDDPAWDAAEAEALYNLLEHEIVPEFYARDTHGIPQKWVSRMRESMAQLTPVYSANRTVREYTEKHYLQAADAYARRAADGGKLGAAIAGWQTQVARHWDEVRFGAVEEKSEGGQWVFNAQVFLGALDPGAVRVELYADGIAGGEAFRQSMSRGEGDWYSARVAATRDARDFTVRVMGEHADAAVPLEAGEILWQR